MISGIVTAVLLAAFLGVTVWAWSSRNREKFRDAAQLPLRDEAVAHADGQCCGCGKAQRS